MKEYISGDRYLFVGRNLKTEGSPLKELQEMIDKRKENLKP